MQVEGVAYTGGQRQHLLRGGGELLKTGHEHVHHVGAEGQGLDLRQIPGPCPGVGDKGERSGGMQGLEVFSEEKRIALGFRRQQGGQGLGPGGRPVHGLGNDPGYGVLIQRAQPDLLQARGGGDLLQGPPQRMALLHFLVPTGPNHQQMGEAARGEQMAQELERGRIAPLQVI